MTEETHAAKQYDRRSILKRTGTGLAATAGLVGFAGSAQAALDAPQNVSVWIDYDSRVYLQWDRANDESDVDHYTLGASRCGYKHCHNFGRNTVDSSYDWGPVDNLKPDTEYTFSVAAVDEDGNVGHGGNVTAKTEPAPFLIDDFSSETKWDANRNDVGGEGTYEGKYTSAQGFVSSSIESHHLGDYLDLDYDSSGGIYRTKVNEDVSNYDFLTFRVRSTESNSLDHCKLTWGGLDGARLSTFTDDDLDTPDGRTWHIENVTVPLDGDGYTVENPGEIELDFSQGWNGDSTFDIYAVWISNVD